MFNSGLLGETAESLAIEHELHDVAALLKEESRQYRRRQEEIDHKLNYEGLRKAILDEDLTKFTEILKKVSELL